MKNVKKIFLVVLVANVIMFVLTGCFQKQNVVAVINDEQISEPLYRIFLWVTQQGFESLNPDIWKMDNLEGKTPEDFAKDRALHSIGYYVVAKEKAQELGIQLTKEDKEEVKKSAKQAMKENETINKSFDIKQKDYETFYSYMRIRDKVVTSLSASYEPSEEEIKEQINQMKQEHKIGDEAQIIQVFISTKDEQGQSIPDDKKEQAYEKAKEVLKKAQAGQDMSELAKDYSEDESVQDNNGKYTFKRGTLDENLEEIVFEKAEVNEVYPEVIETQNGYEVVKVLSVKKADEQTVREEAIEAIGTEYATNELLDMGNLAEIEQKDSLSDIHLMNIGDENKEQ